MKTSIESYPWLTGRRNDFISQPIEPWILERFWHWQDEHYFNPAWQINIIIPKPELCGHFFGGISLSQNPSFRVSNWQWVGKIWVFQVFGMDLTPGAIGCALSHMQSLDLEKKTGWKAAPINWRQHFGKIFLGCGCGKKFRDLLKKSRWKMDNFCFFVFLFGAPFFGFFLPFRKMGFPESWKVDLKNPSRIETKTPKLRKVNCGPFVFFFQKTWCIWY